MHLKNLIIILSIIFLISAEELPYKKVIHNTDPQAKCLDGTSPAIYVHEGGDDSKFLLFFMGGGYCSGTTLGQVLQSCFDRSQSENGSSDPWPQQFQSQGGYLSTDPEISKFATWTKFIILYCDGALHQGYNQFPVSFRGVSLYFRGQKNVKSHLKWITNNYNFQQAQKVVLTGASAGGIATFLYSNYVRSLLTNPQAFYAIADSGVFINATNPYTGEYLFSQRMYQLSRISNTDAFTPITTCNKKFVGEEYKCLFAQNSFTSIEGRMLLLNSEYDEVALEDGMSIQCLVRQKKIPLGKSLQNCTTQQMQYIEDYRAQYLSFLGIFMQFSKNNVWSISCCAHSYACYRERYNVDVVKVPAIEGATVKDVVESFVFDNQRISSIDEVSWPDNGPCAY